MKVFVKIPLAPLAMAECLMMSSAGDDSHLHVVPAGNLQSPSGLWRAEKSHDRFNIRERGGYNSGV